MVVRNFLAKFKRISYMPGQVVVVGPEGHIARARSLIEKRFRMITLERALKGQGDALDLDEAITVLNACEHLKPTRLLGDFLGAERCKDTGRWRADLYQIRGLGSVKGVVQGINEISERHALCVLAGPNYLLGYPHTLAGSPHTLAGSPHTLAGSPYTVFGGPANAADYHHQWAFQHIGLFQGGVGVQGYTGEQVQVGVFDTCPFRNPGPVPQGQVDLPLDLTVFHPPLFDLLPVPPPVRPLGAPDFPDLSGHGLAVSGLVYGVAPKSEIYLYRVLDQYARGNLFVLASALLDFVGNVPSDQAESKGRVTNLSLGVPGLRTWDLGMLLLEILLAFAYCKGIIVVAAAGNGSSTSSLAQPAEYPARYPCTLGVAASNYDKDRACFSNEGEIAAPGGDGLPGDCAPASEGFFGDRKAYSLISLVSTSEGHPDGFGFCTGTSFATPLVAGQAVLILEQISTSASAAQGGGIPAQVFDQIKNNTLPQPYEEGLGAGIIDVPNSLI
jgi:subtilisin family serine protease